MGGKLSGIRRMKGILSFFSFKLFFSILSFSLLMTAGPSWSEQLMSLSRYSLGAGDKIHISVFGDSDMERELILSDAGTVSYPFLGEFRVRGMTVGQLENHVTEKLKDGYFVDPRVSVAIIEYRKFFVSGEVKSPGGFSFEPGLTLDKAVALAGGFTQRADKKEILVTRDSDGAPIERELALSESVLPGDIITVNESFF